MSFRQKAKQFGHGAKETVRHEFKEEQGRWDFSFGRPSRDRPIKKLTNAEAKPYKKGQGFRQSAKQLSRSHQPKFIEFFPQYHERPSSLAVIRPAESFSAYPLRRRRE